MNYVAAVDQGTSSTKVILFDINANPVCSHSLEHETYRPKPGWEEHDPKEILRNVKICIDKCMEVASSKHSIDVSQVKAIGITNQRETTVVWDKVSGIPLYNAIVWQDNRTHSTCDRLRARKSSDVVRDITGLPISTYFSGVKLRWLMDNVDGVYQAMVSGTALFGTIDTWLVWNLSREQAHVTDVTNAGRTMLMNLKSLSWDDDMLKFIDIPRNILPNIISSSQIFGHLSCTLLRGIPMSGLIGDQQSALVGQSCFEVGEAKCTYGTGGFLIINTGLQPKKSQNGLLTTPAYKLGPDAPCVYSLEGSVAVVGSAVTWMRDALSIIDNSSHSEIVASSVSTTGGVYVVPAFTGLYAPWWREDARGTIVGMTQYTTRGHIVRATLESITYKVNDVLNAASEDMGTPILELRVDGRVTKNSLVMQMQADITNINVVRPKVTETTALGAAFCAGRAIGLFQSLDSFRQAWELDTKFTPKINQTERSEKLRLWNKAVEKSLGWADYDDVKSREVSLGGTGIRVRAMVDRVSSRDFWIGITAGVCVTCIALQVASRGFGRFR